VEQTIKFCTASDGVRLAYATMGSGPPIVRVGQWFTHLEFELTHPARRRLLEQLARTRTVVRYDMRGTGLSDRNVADLSFDRTVEDLGTVVDAAGLERFALLGISQGSAVGAAYAAHHPERLSHLVFVGAFARGSARREGPGQGPEAFEALRGVIRAGWGSDDSSWRQLFTTQFLPEASADTVRWYNELERLSASAEVAERIQVTTQNCDVRALAPKIRTPTLVLHCRGDRRVPYDAGMELASLISGARFVPLDSNNHVPIAGEPAWDALFAEVTTFLGDQPPPSWKRKARAAGHTVHAATHRFEASTIFKLLAIAAAVASIVGFVISIA
jgi:pimeloyl-ACP methyl ester carboxylesterase